MLEKQKSEGSDIVVQQGRVCGIVRGSTRNQVHHPSSMKYWGQYSWWRTWLWVSKQNMQIFNIITYKNLSRWIYQDYLCQDRRESSRPIYKEHKWKNLQETFWIIYCNEEGIRNQVTKWPSRVWTVITGRVLEGQVKTLMEISRLHTIRNWRLQRNLWRKFKESQRRCYSSLHWRTNECLVETL